MTSTQPTLSALLSTHDATHREYSTAIARGDSKGAEVAAQQLGKLGQQIDAAAQQDIAAIDGKLGQLEAMTPQMQNQMRELSIQAANLGRLASEQYPSADMNEELRQARARASREGAKSMAMIVLFITLALALVTGHYGIVIVVGMAALFLVYKPFSTSFRWHNIYRKLRDI